MIFAIECVVFCLLMFIFCFIGTGNDLKNLKSFASYPKELQDLLKQDDKYKDAIHVSSPIIVFISNVIIFLIFEFIFGLFIRKPNFLYNFIALLILGQIGNLFDLLICDFIYFRNAKRVRFTEYQDKKLYSSMKAHVYAFLRAIIMFTIVAAIDGALLMLF